MGASSSQEPAEPANEPSSASMEQSDSLLPASTPAQPVDTPVASQHASRVSTDVAATDLPSEEEEHLLEEEAGASSVSSVFTLCNSAIGAGVLALPYAFRCAGVLGCLILCAALGLAEGMTLYVLSKFAERYDATTYSILVRRALGRKLSAALSATLVIYQLGSCAAYLIIVGDSFGPLIALAAGHGSWFANRDVVISFFALAVVLPMCFPRNLSSLHWVSTAGVIGFMYTAAVIFYEGLKIALSRPDPWADVAVVHWNFRALFAIPIIVFGFNCHANVVSIFNELHEDPKLLVTALPSEPAEYRRQGTSSLAPKPKTKKMIGMISVILAAVFVIMAGYLAVGFAGYLAYPNSVSSNVLKTFPRNRPLLQVARAAIGCVVVGHYPLNAHPARVGLEHLEAFILGWKHLSPIFSAVQTVVFVCITLAIALAVTDLGQVLHMIGGTAAAFIIFFLPGLLLINAAIVKLHEAPSDPLSEDTEAPLLAEPHERGIKCTGLIYSPRRSWWLGISLVVLAVAIFIITIATAIFPPPE